MFLKVKLKKNKNCDNFDYVFDRKVEKYVKIM